MGFILPQFGIFAQGTHAHHFLEFDLLPDVTPTAAVASFRRLRTSEVSAGGVNLVVAFGADAWREVAPAEAPASLDRFHAITAPDGRGAPATQHDAWIWISSSSPDVAFDHARAAANAVADAALLVAEQPGFAYHEGRDETGFVDGTANPPVRRAAEVALVPPGEPGQGGSHVLAMRWVHDLDAFHSLPVGEQEAVIGRTKVDSVELADADKPPTAHIARVEIEADGRELPIFRRSVPYGNVGEHGLYFVAFSADPSRYERMLARMFGTSARRRAGPPDGLLATRERRLLLRALVERAQRAGRPRGRMTMAHIEMPPEDVRTKRELPRILDAQRRLQKGNDLLPHRGRVERGRGEGAEPTGSAGKSGALRAAIFGVNDGLLTNTSLIMGFAGASQSRSVIVLAGISGLLAGAFSMGSGEYVSMRVQREVLERLLHLEAHEIGNDPVGEQEELTTIYERKGFSRDLAERVSQELMRDPKMALDTHAREELGIDPDEGLGSPWGAAISSFVMFAFGAFLPLIPFFFRGGSGAVLAAAGDRGRLAPRGGCPDVVAHGAKPGLLGAHGS